VGRTESKAQGCHPRDCAGFAVAGTACQNFDPALK
jgi:hypothetical protein